MKLIGAGLPRTGATRVIDGALLSLREWRDQEAPATSPA
jgi:hypothetical protein